MSITFYASPASSSSPVACALLELAVPHERINFNLPAQEQRAPTFLALNPNGKVPTLVVDGEPLFETLAILQWLGERYGVARGVWPQAGTSNHFRALSWTTWAYVTCGQVFGRYAFASSPRVDAKFHNPELAKSALAELQALLGLLNAELKKAPYLLGQEFSLADLVLSCAVNYWGLCGVSADGHRALSDWLGRCAERPSLKSPWI